MQQHDFPNNNDPLDLLRRFVPTPLKAVYRIGSVNVVVRTNDITLLPAFPLGADLNIDGEQILEWKLIRDTDSPGLLEEPVFLNSGALTIVEMGTACLLALDHERRELLGFIGADVDARTHQEFLVPFLCRMTNEVFAADPFHGFVSKGDAND
jgi:hypothetical protein